jgi:hypothetical protein
LRHHAASWKVAGSIPGEVIGFVQLTRAIEPQYDPDVSSASDRRVPGISLGVKGGWSALKADNLTAICELIA